MSAKKSARTSAGLEIVPLEPEDTEAAYRLDQLCFPGEMAFPKYLFSYLLNSPDCLCLAARDKGRLAGFVIAQALSPRKARLVTLDVAEAFRKRDLARRLVLTTHAFFQSRGFKEVELEVAVNNQSAISLYEKLGYRRLALKKKYYPDGTNALRMEKNL